MSRAATQGRVLPCKNEESYRLLEKKAFRQLPREMLLTLTMELSLAAIRVYMVLYDQSELVRHKNKQRCSVRISHSKLGQLIKKSTSTAGRALKELKEMGYIEISDQGSKGDIYFQNEIRVYFPEHHVDRILATEEDRARPNSGKASAQTSKRAPQICTSTAPNMTISRPRYDHPLDNNREHKNTKTIVNSVEATAVVIKNEDRKIFKAGELVARRDELLTQYRMQGGKISKFEKCLAENFTPEERQIIFEADRTGKVKQESEPQIEQLNPEKPIREEVNATQQEQTRPASTIPLKTKRESRHGTNDTYRKVMPSEEIKTLEKKITWMHKSREIKGDAANRPLSELINEVSFHVANRTEKTPTFKHALEAAAKMLREGRWLTPKKMLYYESIARERMREREKEMERHNWQSDSDVLNNLVSAMRVNNPYGTGGLHVRC